MAGTCGKNDITGGARLSAAQMIARGALFILLATALFHRVSAQANEEQVILALGDSLTAGYGVAPDESYPARLQELLRQNGHRYQVINAGVSGDTTAGGLRRARWLLRQRPAIVILELGANDGLRGQPLAPMHDNLRAIIQLFRAQKVPVLLAGMKIPPNYGEDYAREFEAVYQRLARELDLPLLPFFLDGVAGKRALTQPDGIHPTGAGYKTVAETVFRHLQPLLRGKR